MGRIPPRENPATRQATPKARDCFLGALKLARNPPEARFLQTRLGRPRPKPRGLLTETCPLGRCACTSIPLFIESLRVYSGSQFSCDPG
jgi:hypothetical protein